MPSSAVILAALHWQYPRAAGFVGPLAAVLSAAVVWTYAPQVRRSGRRWVWGLAAMRVAAVLTLAASLLRPAVSRPRTAGERGAVVMLVDDSRSMGVTDTARPAGQRVAVAAALGRLPAGTGDRTAAAFEGDAERLSALADDVARARSDVGYAKLAGRDEGAAGGRLAAAVAAVHRAARLMAADAAGAPESPPLVRALAYLSAVPAGVDPDAWLDRVGDRARAAAVEAERARVSADGRLYDDDPAVHDAADAVADQTRAQLAWAAAADLAARLGPDVPTVAYAVGDRATPVAVPSTAPADGTASNLAGGVRAVLERLAATAAAGDAPPRAVVLLSDGRQVNGEPAETVAAAAPGVPVLTVAVAARAVSPNVSVTALSVPPAVRVGEPTVCRATVRGVGVNGVSTHVLFSAGDGDEQAARVTFTDDRPTPVAFTWVPRSAGATAVSAWATPVAGEATDADNGQQRWTRAVAAPVRVTAVAAADGWEFEAACASLALDPSVRLTDGLVSPTVPSADDLAAADVVVLFGVTARSLSAGQWDAVTRVAGDRGGGVVLVAGEGGFGPGVPAASPLARLLPFAGGPPAWAERPVANVRPTGDADAPHLSSDPVEDGRRWAALPPVDGVLATAALRPDARPLLTGSGGAVLLAGRAVGAGRALCLGTDRTWRWQAPHEADFDRFWTGLVRAAAGPPYAVEQGGVAMDVDALAVLPGQPVHVRLRASGGRGPWRVRVGGPAGETIRTVPFVGRSGGRAEATVGGLAAGEYTLEASAADGRSARLPVRVRPTYDAELADVTGDDGFLRRLAEATGGRAFRLEQLDAVAARLAAAPADPAPAVERPLWDGPYLMAVVVGLLTAEWALRRRAGLA